MNPFKISGIGLKPDQISTCVIYDANSGQIHHTHTVATFGGAKPRSQEEVASEALLLAKESGRDLGNARVLHISGRELNPSVQYKVDLKTLSLVEDADIPEEEMKKLRKLNPRIE